MPSSHDNVGAAAGGGGGGGGVGVDGVLQVALDTANTAINALRIAQDFTELICMNRRFYRTPSYRQRAANS